LFRGDAHMALVLILAGVVTALPLLWFASAAERLRLSTLGLFQYLAPSGPFLLACSLTVNPFTRAHGLAFGCIWIALVVYSMDAVRTQRTRRRGEFARRERFVVS
jgi:chloramphenicol-sensitive protein RarD